MKSNLGIFDNKQQQSSLTCQKICKYMWLLKPPKDEPPHFHKLPTTFRVCEVTNADIKLQQNKNREENISLKSHKKLIIPELSSNVDRD